MQTQDHPTFGFFDVINAIVFQHLVAVLLLRVNLRPSALRQAQGLEFIETVA